MGVWNASGGHGHCGGESWGPDACEGADWLVRMGEMDWVGETDVLEWWAECADVLGLLDCSNWSIGVVDRCLRIRRQVAKPHGLVVGIQGGGYIAASSNAQGSESVAPFYISAEGVAVS